MSNSRRLRRSARRSAVAIAARYSCGHCNAAARITAAGHGLVVLDVLHDASCPMLRGQVSRVPALLRAIGA